MNKNILVLAMMVPMMMFVGTVKADGDTQTETKKTTTQVCRVETGSYGSSTTICEDVVKEVVDRKDISKVETGIAEVMFVVAGLFAGGFGLFVIAQKQLKV